VVLTENRKSGARSVKDDWRAREELSSDRELSRKTKHRSNDEIVSIREILQRAGVSGDSSNV